MLDEGGAPRTRDLDPELPAGAKHGWAPDRDQWFEVVGPVSLSQWRAAGVRLLWEAQVNGFRGVEQVWAGISVLVNKLGAPSKSGSPSQAAAYTVREGMTTEWFEAAPPVLAGHGMPLPPACVKKFIGFEDLDVFGHARLTDGKVIETGEEAACEAVVGNSPGDMALDGSGRDSAWEEGSGGEWQTNPIPSWFDQGAASWQQHQLVPTRSQGHDIGGSEGRTKVVVDRILDDQGQLTALTSFTSKHADYRRVGEASVSPATGDEPVRPHTNAPADGNPNRVLLRSPGGPSVFRAKAVGPPLRGSPLQ